MDKRAKVEKQCFISVLMVLFPLFTGGFFEYSSCAFTAVLLGWLWKEQRGDPLQWKTGWSLVGVCALCCGYALGPIWAVDRGMAAVGCSKYIPLLLLAIVFQKHSNQARVQALEVIPWCGGAMVLLSAAVSLFPASVHLVTVNHRLSGTFQYPNVFALFLLLGIAVLLVKERWDLKQWGLAVTMLGGILASGSRSVFLLLGGLCVFAIVKRKSVTGWRRLPGIIGAGLLGSALYVWVTGDVSNVGRYLTTSLSSSTFLGRLLYMKDAFPVILSHPLGLGYMGYYFSQGSFQHGVYSVAYVHNDLMQILLDVGWLPGGLFFAAVWHGLRSRGTALVQKMILSLILLHCMLDFDLQYISVFAILLLCLDWEDEWRHDIRLGKGARVVVGTVLLLFSVWMGSSNLMLYLGRADLSAAVFPYNTMANVQLLTQAQTAEEMEQLSERILRTNRSLPIAWSAKAEVAFSRGDLATVMRAKRKVLDGARYINDEYLDYFRMLVVAEELYQKAGDLSSAAACRKEMGAIRDRMERTLEETDPLAWRIADKPELYLPPEYERYLAEN